MIFFYKQSAPNGAKAIKDGDKIKKYINCRVSVFKELKSWKGSKESCF
jgi:hypothetical protein